MAVHSILSEGMLLSLSRQRVGEPSWKNGVPAKFEFLSMMKLSSELYNISYHEQYDMHALHDRLLKLYQI